MKNRHTTDGHRNLQTESAQRANSVKMGESVITIHLDLSTPQIVKVLGVFSPSIFCTLGLKLMEVFCKIYGFQFYANL